MMSTNFCKFNFFGHCKYGTRCLKPHPLQTCWDFPNKIQECLQTSRHPRPCKFFEQFGNCKFGDDCSYIHISSTKSELEIKALQCDIDVLKAKSIEMENLIIKMEKLEKNLIERLEITENKCEWFENQFKLKCDLCSDIFANETLMREHNVICQEKEKPNDKFICDLCCYSST